MKECTTYFDKNRQYGDYFMLTDGSNETFEIAQSILKKQINRIVPKMLRHLVVWIKHHFEASTILVKDDNYEMLGVTKDKIGTRLDIPEHWSIGWKYTPEAKS